MAKLPQAVNTNDFADDIGFEPLPAGWYTAQIVDSELKESKAGMTGLNLQFEIIGPTHAGRKIFNWFNLYHEKATVKEIAERQFSTLCRACGLGGVVDDTDHLHGRPLQIRLTVSKSEQYGDGNDVKGYKATSTGAPGVPGVPAAAPKPWETPAAPMAPPVATAPPVAPIAQAVPTTAPPAPAIADDDAKIAGLIAAGLDPRAYGFPNWSPPVVAPAQVAPAAPTAPGAPAVPEWLK